MSPVVTMNIIIWISILDATQYNILYNVWDTMWEALLCRVLQYSSVSNRVSDMESDTCVWLSITTCNKAYIYSSLSNTVCNIIYSLEKCIVSGVYISRYPILLYSAIHPSLSLSFSISLCLSFYLSVQIYIYIYMLYIIYIQHLSIRSFALRYVDGVIYLLGYY